MFVWRTLLSCTYSGLRQYYWLRIDLRPPTTSGRRDSKIWFWKKITRRVLVPAITWARAYHVLQDYTKKLSWDCPLASRFILIAVNQCFVPTACDSDFPLIKSSHTNALNPFVMDKSISVGLIGNFMRHSSF